MMQTIPATIRIGAFDLTVELENEKGIFLAGEQAIGAYDAVNQRIILDTLIIKNDVFMGGVLLHEVMHAFLQLTGIDDDELTVEKLALNMLSLIRDNPALFKYLLGVFNKDEVESTQQQTTGLYNPSLPRVSNSPNVGTVLSVLRDSSLDTPAPLSGSLTG